MVKYKIGQISKSMGVSTHLLKHYEEFYLLKSEQDENTRYRYYDFAQCARLIESRKIRNIGVPIKDIYEITTQYDNEQYNNMLDNQIDSLENDIKIIQEKINKAKELKQESIECDEFLDEWVIEISNAKYVLPQSKNKILLKDNTVIIGKTNLLDFMPYCKPTMYISKNNLYSEDFNYQWGLCIDEKYVIDNDIKISKQFIKIEQTRTFVATLKIQVPYCDNSRIMQKIKDIFLPLNFQAKGDIIANNIKSIKENNKLYHYFKIYIPI